MNNRSLVVSFFVSDQSIWTQESGDLHFSGKSVYKESYDYEIFHSGIGGYPPPPLTENHPAQKPLAEMGGTPPLTEKIR